MSPASHILPVKACHHPQTDKMMQDEIQEAESRISTPSSATSNETAQRQTKICVFCGASKGNKPEHIEMARSLARVMAANNIGLVYGGGTVGLMGELARTLVSVSGPEAVHGVIPLALVQYERHGDPQYKSLSCSPDGSSHLPVPSHSLYGRTTIVKDMHTRKALMAKEVIEGGPGSGFIALSGGYGTLEELLETATWNQLGIHDKGICLLNVNGFYDGLIEWIGKAVDEGFIREGNFNIVSRAESAEEAVRMLREYTQPDSVFKLEWGTQ